MVLSDEQRTSSDEPAGLGAAGGVGMSDGERAEAWNLFAGGGKGQGPTLAGQQGVKLAADEVIQKLVSA